MVLSAQKMVPFWVLVTIVFSSVSVVMFRSCTPEPRIDPESFPYFVSLIPFGTVTSVIWIYFAWLSFEFFRRAWRRTRKERTDKKKAERKSKRGGCSWEEARRKHDYGRSSKRVPITKFLRPRACSSIERDGHFLRGRIPFHSTCTPAHTPIYTLNRMVLL